MCFEKFVIASVLSMDWFQMVVGKFTSRSKFKYKITRFEDDTMVVFNKRQTQLQRVDSWYMI